MDGTTQHDERVAAAPGRTGYGDRGLMRASDTDVAGARERGRRRRLWITALVLAAPFSFLWYRILTGRPFDVFALPDVDPFLVFMGLFLVVIVGLVVGMTWGAGRSPHSLLRPEQIDVRLDDVKGLDDVKDDVVRTLNMFLAHKTYAADTGGNPRRGVLFEGPPGTGKTYMAKAMAREAGVPFLFVSATAFQSMYYGATARKIRSYFTALRATARREGGAIGFIEEIDAIAASRAGMSMTPLGSTGLSAVTLGCSGAAVLPPLPATATGGGTAHASTSVDAAGSGTTTSAMRSEGVSGVVNELLVQMQSFDEPVGMAKLLDGVKDKLNAFLPVHRQLRKSKPERTNLLLIAATNRADDLDPALLRPGRFDRRLAFDPPGQAGRRQLVDFFLSSRRHAPEMDDEDRRDALAGLTQGYTPVKIEHLLDEAIVQAVNRGERELTWADVETARLVEEVGMGQPTAYTERERRVIATHEAGHAVTAYLAAPERRLEVLTIVKRRDALGLLAHGDAEEVFTRSRSEMNALISIAMGGQVAEELFFDDDPSTGPAGDLLYATTTAVQMVGACGMDESLISMAAVQGGFGDSGLAGRVLGDAQSRERVDRLLHARKDVTRTLLGENRHLVEALRDALLERSELVGHEITDVLQAAEREARDAPRVVDLTAAEGRAGARA